MRVFDVTRLAANDPMALLNSLSDNGFPNPEGLEQNLAPYVVDHRMDPTAVPVLRARARSR